ncbi:MAG: helix-turn-helix domain-containing protein, partial [Planctomycetota bacterium]
LFYRLKVLSILLPPLRERSGDLPLLVTHFLKQSTPSGQPPKQVTPHAMGALERYDWPGNVRELENEIRRLIAVAGEVIHEEDISEQVRGGRGVAVDPDVMPDQVRNLDELVRKVEVEEIRRALRVAEANKTRAAQLLGISRFTLQRKIEKYRLEP